MDQIDREALELCMQLFRKDSLRAEQIDAKLRDEPWEEVAEFASSCLQGEALHLKPWQEPPCVAFEDDDPEERDKQAQALLRRMLSAGVSRFAPDPMAALEAAGG